MQSATPNTTRIAEEQQKINMDSTIEQLKSLDKPALIKSITGATLSNPEHVADVFLHLVESLRHANAAAVRNLILADTVVKLAANIQDVTEERDAAVNAKEYILGKYNKTADRYNTTAEGYNTVVDAHNELIKKHDKLAEAFDTLDEEYKDAVDLNDHLLRKTNYAPLPIYRTYDIDSDDEDEEEAELEVRAPGPANADSSPLSSIPSDGPSMHSNSADDVIFQKSKKRARSLSIASTASSVELDKNLIPKAKFKPWNPKPKSTSTPVSASTSVVTTSPFKPRRNYRGKARERTNVDSEASTSAQLDTKVESNETNNLETIAITPKIIAPKKPVTPKIEKSEPAQPKPINIRPNKKHPNIHHCTLTPEELQLIRPNPEPNQLKRFAAVRPGTLPRFVINDEEYVVLMNWRNTLDGKSRWKGRLELKENDLKVRGGSGSDSGEGSKEKGGKGGGEVEEEGASKRRKLA